MFCSLFCWVLVLGHPASWACRVPRMQSSAFTRLACCLDMVPRTAFLAAYPFRVPLSSASQRRKPATMPRQQLFCFSSCAELTEPFWSCYFRVKCLILTNRSRGIKKVEAVRVVEGCGEYLHEEGKEKVNTITKAKPMIVARMQKCVYCSYLAFLSSRPKAQEKLSFPFVATVSCCRRHCCRLSPVCLFV